MRRRDFMSATGAIVMLGGTSRGDPELGPDHKGGLDAKGALRGKVMLRVKGGVADSYFVDADTGAILDISYHLQKIEFEHTAGEIPKLYCTFICVPVEIDLDTEDVKKVAVQIATRSTDTLVS